jgi:prefoldin alpha subunit
MTQEELKRKYVEFQLLEQQMKQTQKQLQLLEEQVVELIVTHQGLEDLKHVKEGSEILVPVSSGIFAKARLESVDKLILNVGANTAVPKTIEETQETLNKQMTEIQGLQTQLIEAHQKLEQHMDTLQKEITKLVPEGEA